MAVFETLTLAERARQLGNPEGPVGLAVAKWLNENNRQASIKNLALLGVEAGNRVLEIGFGNGRTMPDVIAQAVDVTYCGIDISPTMVTEASTFNAVLVASGRASFYLASAENMPFAEDSFDRDFLNRRHPFLDRAKACSGGSTPGDAPRRLDANGLSGAKGSAGFRPAGIRLPPPRCRELGCALPRRRLYKRPR